MIETSVSDQHLSRQHSGFPLMARRLRDFFVTSPPDFGNRLFAAVQPQWRTKLSWAREVAALQSVVEAMREELQETRDQERRVSYMAFHDDLTALPNRRYFLERLSVALRSDEAGHPNLAVIYLDLDGFKALNDGHGHDAGDEFLKFVAARLAHTVRAEDLVSRLGGDEYACLITGVVHQERLQEIALALFKAVAAPFKIGISMITINPSIGIAVYPVNGTTSATLMKSADVAMYAAKRTKSGIVFAEPAHRELAS